MTDETPSAKEQEPGAHKTPGQSPPGREPLSPAARRALAEAEARRAAAAAASGERPVEHQGPKGPEPTRYGDWERKGIASDF